MNDIGRKTTSALIDELITTSMKCWHAQDGVCKPGASELEVAKSAKLAQETNARRCALMRAIDERLGESEVSVTPKTY
jgi:hypothetical protein